MRIRLPESRLREAVAKSLEGSPPNPDPADLLDLYLFLPLIDHRGLMRVTYRSSMEALLTDAHRITGRDDDGNVVQPEHLGTWLGAMGYLALVDQIGKAIRWSDRDDGGARTGFERILIQSGKSQKEAAALYALRNAMVHSFGLLNENKDRPEARHYFHLDVFGGGPLEYPQVPWRGDLSDAASHATKVSLEAIGNLGEELVFGLAGDWVRDGNVELAKNLTPQRMRLRYFFTFLEVDPDDEQARF